MGFNDNVLNSFQDIWPKISQVACCSISASFKSYFLRSVCTANNMAFCCFWVNSDKSLNGTLPGFLMPRDSRHSAKCSARHAPPLSASLYFFLYNRLGWLIVYQLIVSFYPLNDYIYMHNNTSKCSCFFRIGLHIKKYL